MGIKQREKFHSKCMENILTQTRNYPKIRKYIQSK